ncbi:hypothetical protein AcV7_005945 [Taiwanofungus camphoratus]|nr:hypothetical protein AcV7_005945 [Antrodia cinnamomea]
MLGLLGKLLLISSAFATGKVAWASSCDPLQSPPSSDEISSFLSIKFDYLIVGGGTAGVALAARLAEDANITVGVLEAGAFHLGDPNVDIPTYSSNTVGNPEYDWNFVTVPQTNAGGRNLSVSRGKMLGGSSGINGLAWNRASSAEYDAWSTFAQNLSWGWDGLLPLFKKSENVSLTPKDPYPGISSEEAQAALHNLPYVEGLSGPIVASYNSWYPEDVPLLVKSLNGIGVPTNAQPQGGNATGVYDTLACINRTAGVRTYSAMGYYCLQAPRENLHILVGAQATKVFFAANVSPLTATGVQFVVGQKYYIANATKEVILSTGSIQTPQLLELSGIGNSTILSASGIPTLFNLPSVGENLQEHLFVAVQWLLKPGIETFDIMRNNATFAAEQAALYNATHTGFLTNTDSTVGFIPLPSIATGDNLTSLLEIFDQEAQQAATLPIQQLQYPIQRSWAAEGNVAFVEFIQWSKGFIAPQPNQSYVTLLGGIVHPMSRGSVHITTNDPLASPAIDMGFLNHDFDASVLLNVLRYMQTIGKTSPFASIVVNQTNPDPAMQTDDDLLEYIRSGSAGGDHPIGTAAMAPLEYGGVVDSTLKVYGTSNLRVVDASIFPLHIAAHTQSTVYAIAEKAAEMIKQSNY